MTVFAGSGPDPQVLWTTYMQAVQNLERARTVHAGMAQTAGRGRADYGPVYQAENAAAQAYEAYLSGRSPVAAAGP